MVNKFIFVNLFIFLKVCLMKALILLLYLIPNNKLDLYLIYCNGSCLKQDKIT